MKKFHFSTNAQDAHQSSRRGTKSKPVGGPSDKDSPGVCTSLDYEAPMTRQCTWPTAYEALQLSELAKHIEQRTQQAQRPRPPRPVPTDPRQQIPLLVEFAQ